jgi:hypothetical protein
LFLGHEEAEHQSRGAWWSSVAHLMTARKQREALKKRLGTVTSSKGMPPSDLLLPTRLHFLFPTTSR